MENTICQIFVDAHARLQQNDKLSDEAKDFFRQELDKLRLETAIVQALDQERQDKLRQEIAKKAFEVANEINNL